MFYRLIKPDWAIPTLANGDPNPEYKKQIEGNKTIEGCLKPEEVKHFNELGYNAYWFPNHPSTNVYENGTRYLSGKMIDVFNYVFVDMDSKDGIYTVDEFLNVLREFPVKPTITVKSGHGVHAYWRIQNLSREEYILTQLALLRYLRTDESVWTVLQLMRVPGSLNTKEMNNYRLAEPVKDLSTGQIYENIGVFPGDIFNLSEEDKNRMQSHINKLDGKLQVHLSEDINIDELPDSFLNLMYENESIYQLFNNPAEHYGDRSGADMSLANILFRRGISKKDAIAVISNSQKALSKGAYRLDYATSTVDKAYVDQTENKFKTVGQRLREGFDTIELDPVNGPKFFDCLVNKWSKTQILGLVAGSGVGKTAVTLKIFKDMIENSTDNDDVFVFFSLEMQEAEIVKRWIKLVGNDSPLADRLYVIDTNAENGDQRIIGLQEIYEYCRDIKNATGKEISAIAIDHIGITSKHIDTRKKYTFGVESEQMSGWGDTRTISLANLCTQLKTLAKMLNTFVIPLTQTTKEKGLGYTPLGKDAAFGVSQYENIVDYMITLWQPLMLVQEQTPYRFLSWQYAKVRNQDVDDPVKPNTFKLLTYDMVSGDLYPTTEDEYKVFSNLLPLALERAKEKEKKIETQYTRSISIDTLKDIDDKIKLVKNMG